nr:putative pentatricopeptide repeat-containing protein At3g25970 [Tanacetum cinerariifolium]
MKPDEITYLEVLSSCSHAGLVKEARNHLDFMFDLHGVILCFEHYTCVVDVRGKVGKSDDAKKLIGNMPMIPDAQIWKILLFVCNIYGDVDIRMVAARELVALQPELKTSLVLFFCRVFMLLL